MKLPGTVLIIDDDHDDLELIGEALDKLGVRSSCEFFNSAKDALLRIRSEQQPPFLILCDLNLSGMSALEFKALLNSDARIGQAIPFIIFTGHADPDEVKASMALKSQGCFIKSIRFEELVETLQAIFIYWKNCLFFR